MPIGVDGKIFLGMAVLSTLLLAPSGALSATVTQVRSDAGMLEGTQEKSLSTFKGIPFAAAPVGQWRWREPQPVVAWEDIGNAKQFGSSCIQAPGLSVLSDAGDPGALNEDCLYLEKRGQGHFSCLSHLDYFSIKKNEPDPFSTFTLKYRFKPEANLCAELSVQ